MSLKPDMRDLIIRAESQGWTITRTGGDHYKWAGPGGQLVFSSSTPSDRRAIKSLRSTLRKNGLALD